MKRVKLIWLAAIAAFALTAIAVTAGSASAAEPEWGHCVPVKSKGHYEDGNCTKEDFKENKAHERKYKGKFEWDSGAAAACFAQKHGKYKDAGCTELDEKKGQPKGKYELTGGPKFTGEGGAGVLRTTQNGCEEPGEVHNQRPRKDCEPACPHEGACGYQEFGEATVECTSEKASGEATGTSEVGNVSVRFKGCTSFSLPATGIGLPAGEIQVNPLKGRLGYINKAKHEVGVLLEPAAAGGLFAEFEIFEGAIMDRVGVGNATTGTFYEEGGTPGAPSGHDGVISPISPINVMTHTFSQNYRAESTKIKCTENCETAEIDQFQNIPSRFEGGPLEVLENFIEGTGNGSRSEWASAGQEVNNVNTVEGNAEIKG